MVLVKCLMALALCAIHHKALTVVRLLWIMMVVSDAVNGGGVGTAAVLGFCGERIALPQMKSIRVNGLWNGTRGKLFRRALIWGYFEWGIRYLCKNGSTSKSIKVIGHGSRTMVCSALVESHL